MTHIIAQIFGFLSALFLGVAIGYVLGFRSGRRAEYVLHFKSQYIHPRDPQRKYWP